MNLSLNTILFTIHRTLSQFNDQWPRPEHVCEREMNLVDGVSERMAFLLLPSHPLTETKAL